MIVECLGKGEFLFIFDVCDKFVSVEKDINLFVMFIVEKNKKFVKNKIVCVLDVVNNDLICELKVLIKLRKGSGSDILVFEDGF